MAKSNVNKKETNELVLTADKPKRTRNVIKWQSSHEAVTCAAFALFIENKDVEPAKLSIVGRKLQKVFESIAQTIKDGKAGKDMIERRDNLDLALSVAGIHNSNIIEVLDKFISLFK